MALDATTRTRTETDSLGSLEIPADAYWGVHTARALENFPISKRPISVYADLVKALAMVKQASARANREIGALDAEKADLIDRAAQLVIDGEYHDQFVVGVVQGGAGTSTNMNANEVITNIALELAGREKGDYAFLSPIDHTNRSQSTNDVYPTAIKVGLGLDLLTLLEELDLLRRAFLAKSDGVPRHPQGRPHAASGRRADDARAGVPRIRHDARRGLPPAQGERLPPVRDQHGRDRDRHRDHHAPRLCGGRVPAPPRDLRTRPRDGDGPRGVHE